MMRKALDYRIYHFTHSKLCLSAPLGKKYLHNMHNLYDNLCQSRLIPISVANVLFGRTKYTEINALLITDNTDKSRFYSFFDTADTTETKWKQSSYNSKII